ncbi:hypothetical protein DMUE_1951 [Dictyocoela muelleri]|nr:hypothetical protein DMUE_1951 [Dictyocoela muelleri]
MDLIILKRVNYQMIIKYTFKDEKKHSSKILRKYEDILSEYNFILVNEKKYTFGYVVDTSISDEFVDIIKLKLRDLDMYLKLIMENILETRRHFSRLNFSLFRNSILFREIIKNTKRAQKFMKMIPEKMQITNDYIFIELTEFKHIIGSIHDCMICISPQISKIFNNKRKIFRVNSPLFGNYLKVKFLFDCVKNISKFIYDKIDKEIYYGFHPLDFLFLRDRYFEIIENFNEIIILYSDDDENNSQERVSNIECIVYIEAYIIKICIIFQEKLLHCVQVSKIPRKPTIKPYSYLYESLFHNIETFIRILEGIPKPLKISFLKNNCNSFFESNQTFAGEELLFLYYHKLTISLKIMKNIIRNQFFWKYHIYTLKIILYSAKKTYLNIKIILISLNKILTEIIEKSSLKKLSSRSKNYLFELKKLIDVLFNKINREINKIDELFNKDE